MLCDICITTAKRKPKETEKKCRTSRTEPLFFSQNHFFSAALREIESAYTSWPWLPQKSRMNKKSAGFLEVRKTCRIFAAVKQLNSMKTMVSDNFKRYDSPEQYAEAFQQMIDAREKWREQIREKEATTAQ